MRAFAYAAAALSAGLLLAAAACTTTTVGTGDGSSSTSSSSSGATVSSAECRNRCLTKAVTCTDTATQASQFCNGMCAGSYTAGQLTCLESQSCAALVEAETVDSVCPPGSSSSGGSSSGGSSGGASGASCVDFGDCTGSPTCACPEGDKLSYWDCVGGRCEAACEFICN